MPPSYAPLIRLFNPRTLFVMCLGAMFLLVTYRYATRSGDSVSSQACAQVEARKPRLRLAGAAVNGWGGGQGDWQ